MNCPHCASPATKQQTEKTSLGYRTFRCSDFRRSFKQRIGTADSEDEEGLKRRCSGCLSAFAELRRTSNARFLSKVERQITGKGQSRSTLQSVMHILVGELEDAF